MQEEVKDRINWEVDRSNPEDKLLDFVRYMKSARDDIEHQVNDKNHVVSRICFDDANGHDY